MGVETYLDHVFAEGAREKAKMMTGKIYQYSLADPGYTLKKADAGRKGKCKIIDVNYNKSIDCYAYEIVDIETNETLYPCQFEVIFNEVTG